MNIIQSRRISRAALVMLIRPHLCHFACHPPGSGNCPGASKVFHDGLTKNYLTSTNPGSSPNICTRGRAGAPINNSNR